MLKRDGDQKKNFSILRVVLTMMRKEKELYLTPENAPQKIQEWQEILLNIKSHRPFTFKPVNCALLVVDMQNVFLDKQSHAYAPTSKSIFPNINRLIDLFAQKKQTIIFTRYIDSEDPEDLMRVWWRNPILETEHESYLTDLLDTTLGTVLKKTKYSAFSHTRLDDLLRDNGITQVLITGLMTHLCCETTARDAFMRNYQVFFGMDTTASYTEALHLGTLRSITHGFGTCITTADIQKAFSEAAKP
jgi:isochorismate hydrolase